jgi:hypothetical protein
MFCLLLHALYGCKGAKLVRDEIAWAGIFSFSLQESTRVGGYVERKDEAMVNELATQSRGASFIHLQKTLYHLT